MSDELLRLEAKVDSIKDDVSEMKIHVATNAVDLQNHMRRTEILEKRMDGWPNRALTGVTLLSAVAMLLKHLMH